MPRPTVSVIMPNYNHARFLPGAIAQILNQTRPPDEFLILDDASTDDSLPIIESCAAKHPAIRVLQNETNAGVMAAHRRLFEAARGDYVYAAAADDRREPRFLECTLALAERFPQAGLVSTKIAVLDEADRKRGEIGVRHWREPLFAEPARVIAEYFDVEAPSHSLCGATVYRRGALREVGWYRDELEFWGDTFSARAIALKHGMCYFPEPLYGWRRLETGFSGAGRTDARRMLQVVRRAAALMRSEPFRDRFPAAHVDRWERRFRRLIAWNAWIGEGVGFRPGSADFWLRAVRGLPKLPAALSLLWSAGPPTGDSRTGGDESD